MDLRSAILTYHSLDNSGSVISTAPEVFQRQLESLAASGIPFVPVDRVASCPGSIAITFDDGYRNLAEHAFPILDRFRIPATIFVVSRYCGQLNTWPSQSPGVVPELPLLSWEQLAAVPSGVDIGAHTVTHPRLPALSAEECDRDVPVPGGDRAQAGAARSMPRIPLWVLLGQCLLHSRPALRACRRHIARVCVARCESDESATNRYVLLSPPALS
jgi:peptidoglycan/xylan/chitin deacetylase (PgdA/CDA1 family)